MAPMWRRGAASSFALAALCGPPSLRAQVKDASTGPVPATEEVAPDSAGEGGSFIPLPVVFYQPETGLGFGVTAISHYRATPGDTLSPPSSLYLVGIYTTKSQLVLGVGSDMYLAEDRWRIASSVSYSSFPTKYWGIGNDAPDSAEEDYTPRTIDLRVWPQKEVAPGWYAGVAAILIDRNVTELTSGGLIDAGLAPGSQEKQALGLGVSFIRDSRDRVISPHRGSYHKLLVDLFADVGFADSGFGLYSLDLRRYLPVAGTHVLAFRALVAASSGEPPFDQYPQLGGESLLRGYYQGRYRDRSLLALQGEYRLPLFGRFGAAGFVGFGQVAPGLDGLGWGRFRAAGGLGLRFLLAKREGLNLRADFAVGEGSSGFYLSVGEAF